MAEYRSKSCSDGKMQIHEANKALPSTTTKPANLRSSSLKGWSSWSFNDPDFQRKRRVASYKVYCVEGKLKGSVRKSFRWLKNRYTRLLYGHAHAHGHAHGWW